MLKKFIVAGGLTLILVGLVVSSSMAGGWAVITLDNLPESPRVGEKLSIGFMVLQHGVTPTNEVEPYLQANNANTGDSIKLSATQEGPEGHFTIAVTFPSEGTWDWEIVPFPLEGTKLQSLVVLPAIQIVSSPEKQSLVQKPVDLRSSLGLLSALVLAVALLLQRKKAVGRPISSGK